MARLAEILLRNLQLGHVGRLANLVEDGAVGLARLEVERSVLGLQDDVRTEFPVEGLELGDGLLHAVFTLVVGTVDKAAPHDDAAEGLQRLGQHVGTVGVRPFVVAGAGLSLAVGLDQEAAEVGNELIDLLGLALPPLSHLRVERVGSLGVAQCHGACEVDAQEDADAIGPKDVGNRLHLLQIVGGEDLRRGVHVVQHGAVDADGRVGACVLADALFVEMEPLEDALARIAALDAPVEVVPVVEQAQGEGRTLGLVDVLSVKSHPWSNAARVEDVGVLQSQQLVGAVEQAPVGAGIDGGLVASRASQLLAGGHDAVALVELQALVEHQLHLVAQLPAVSEFAAGDVDGGRLGVGRHLRDVGPRLIPQSEP